MEDNDIKQPQENTQFEEQIDAAGRSLSNALKNSFFFLKVIMAVVILLFLGSGIFRVQPDEQAMVLRFGKIRGVGDDRILGPGLHWAFPAPIDEIVRIPVAKVHSVPIDSFWYFQTEREKLTGQPGRVEPTLNPTRDGYCLTSNDTVAGIEGVDYNIVHSKWQLNYRIDYPEDFFRNMYFPQLKPGRTFADLLKESVDPFLQSMAADAVVTTMVNYTIDEAIVSAPDIANNVKLLLQERLNEIRSGVTVVAMQVAGKITWPRQVDDAFQQLNMASQEKDRLKTEAKSYYDTVLNQAGGPHAEEVLEKLKQEDLTDKQRETYLSMLSGRAQEQISQARAYRTKVVETAKANADYLLQLLPEYKERPKLALQQIYQDTISGVLDKVDEQIIIPPDQNDGPREIRVLINRNEARAKENQRND